MKKFFLYLSGGLLGVVIQAAYRDASLLDGASIGATIAAFALATIFTAMEF